MGIVDIRLSVEREITLFEAGHGVKVERYCRFRLRDYYVGKAVGRSHVADYPTFLEYYNKALQSNGLQEGPPPPNYVGPQPLLHQHPGPGPPEGACPLAGAAHPHVTVAAVQDCSLSKEYYLHP